MGVKKYAFCSCFFEKNIFIKSWNAHVSFQNDEQFLSDFSVNRNLTSALEEAKNEVARRKKSKFEASDRREAIRAMYSPIVFAEDFNFRLNMFEESFKKLTGQLDEASWNLSRPLEGTPEILS
jgi:hypothetical protein